MGCKANAREKRGEKRVKYRITDHWAITISDKWNNNLIATKKLPKGPEQTNIRRNRQKSRLQPILKWALEIPQPQIADTKRTAQVAWIVEKTDSKSKHLIWLLMRVAIVSVLFFKISCEFHRSVFYMIKTSIIDTNESNAVIRIIR